MTFLETARLATAAAHTGGLRFAVDAQVCSGGAPLVRATTVLRSAREFQSLPAIIFGGLDT